MRGRRTKPGNPMLLFLYPFFLVHMPGFGLSGFLIAYAGDRPDPGFMYAHGGIAVAVYAAFYLAQCDLDEAREMLINAGLGRYAQIGRILDRFGRKIGDYPRYGHVTPFMDYVLYRLLLRQLLLDVTRSRSAPRRRTLVESAYAGVSLLLSTFLIVRN